MNSREKMTIGGNRVTKRIRCAVRTPVRRTATGRRRYISGAHARQFSTGGAGIRTAAFLLYAIAFSLALAAQDADEGGLQYTLIGSVNQDVQFTLREWDSGSTVPASWRPYADITHRFTADQSELTLVHRSVFGGATSFAAPLSTELYEAYLMLRSLPDLDIFLGRKRLNIGTGFLHSSGDTFNPSTSFFDQKTGSLGLQFSYSPTSWLGLTGGVSAERMFAEANKFEAEKLLWSLQGSVLLDALQFQAGLTYGRDYTFNPTAGFSYDIAGIILTGEAALEFLPRGSYVAGNVPLRYESWTAPKPSAAAGIRYTVSNDDADVTLAGEYLYAGQSWTAEDTDAWKNLGAPRFQTPEILPKGFRNRHNLVLKLQAALWSKLSAAGTAVINCTDGSTLLNSTVTFSPWENIDLAASALIGLGEAGTEWEHVRGIDGSPSKMNLTLTTRYHF